MCFADLEKAFDRVPRKVMEWAMRKKGLPEILVKAMMSLYEAAETKVIVGSCLSEEFSVKVGVHQGSVLSPLLFAVVIYEVTENARKGWMKQILCADDLVLMGETMEELRENFDEWREAFESKGMRVNLGKTKLMVSGMEEEAFVSKIDPCGVCGTRVMSNSVLCTACGKWVHARCTDKKKVSVYVNQSFVCKKCRSVVKNFKGSADEKLCDSVKTVSKFTYLGYRLNATGGCETAVTARSRIGWMKFRESSEILKGRRFSLKMKGKIYKSCVRSAMLYGSEAWCLREKEMAILRRTEKAMIRAMCGVKPLDRRNSDELMDMLGMKESLDRMAKASSIRWYGHVLRKEDENVIVKALKFEVSGSSGRGRPKQTWKKQVENEMKKKWTGKRGCM